MFGRVFVALVLIVAACATAAAQNTAIQGWIIAPGQKHADNFEVWVAELDGERIFATTHVGDSGRYLFQNLDLTVGNFDILIRLDGYRESRTPLRIPSRSVIEVPIFANIILIPDAESRRAADTETAYRDSLLEEYSKGLTEVTNKRPELAVPHLEKIVKEIPDFYDAHINLGMVYEDLSRMREAEAEFRRAHELNPESARPLTALGRLFVDDVENDIAAGAKPDVIQPKLAAAREALLEAVMLDEKFAKAHYYLGAVYLRSSAYSDSETELKRALELDSTLFEARIGMINLFVRQKKWQAALDNVDIFLLEYPISPYRKDMTTMRTNVVGQLQSSR